MSVSDETTREWAARAFADHELEVIREDGLYRHWRCQKPGTYVYGFDVVTWPGHLAVCGDIGTWVFSRERDMVEFFDSDHAAWLGAPPSATRINPMYWSEKLQDGPDRARDRRVLEEPQWNDEYGFEMPAGTEVDAGWNTQFIYACYGIVLAIELRKEVGHREDEAA